jgi:hypothetical protein
MWDFVIWINVTHDESSSGGIQGKENPETVAGSRLLLCG